MVSILIFCVLFPYSSLILSLRDISLDHLMSVYCVVSFASARCARNRAVFVCCPLDCLFSWLLLVRLKYLHGVDGFTVQLRLGMRVVVCVIYEM